MKSYWVQTSSSDLIKKVLFDTKLNVKADAETLLEGGTITKILQENISLQELGKLPDVVWSFLLYTGYLKANSTFMKEDEWYVELAIPNREIWSEFRQMARSWFVSQEEVNQKVTALFHALLAGDVQGAQDILGKALQESTSFHDLTREQAYHMFVLGMLVNFHAHYEIRSNQESGYGRYDLVLLPKQPAKPGAVLELKALYGTPRAEMVEKAFAEAQKQIEGKKYALALQNRGAAPIWKYVVVFAGKEAWVRSV